MIWLLFSFFVFVFFFSKEVEVEIIENGEFLFRIHVKYRRLIFFAVHNGRPSHGGTCAHCDVCIFAVHTKTTTVPSPFKFILVGERFQKDPFSVIGNAVLVDRRPNRSKMTRFQIDPD